MRTLHGELSSPVNKYITKHLALLPLGSPAHPVSIFLERALCVGA